MNPNDELPDEFSEQLLERLSDEAMAERSAFSPELHRRILKRVHDEGSVVGPRLGIRLGRWPAAAAAAVLLAGLLVVAFQVVRQRHTPTQNSNAVTVNIVPSPQSDGKRPAILPTAPLAFDLGDLVSANLWPPQIIVSLPSVNPIASAAPETQPAPRSAPIALPGSPEWLFARLQEPTTSADAALSDVVPDEVRILTGWSRADQ